MTRLFLSAGIAIALNATVAGCAAQQGGTIDYSTVAQNAGTFATIASGIAGVFASAHTTAVPPVAPSAAQVSAPVAAPASAPVAASAPL